MPDSIFEETIDRMEKSLISFKNELKRIRTGRANISILDGIKIDCYGSTMQLSQIATLSASKNRFIIIQPWDSSLIKNIEKSIMKSNLGLVPSNDGNFVKIPIPQLTEERRKDLVKIISNKSEEYKIAVRNIRRDSNELLKKRKKKKIISDDIFFKAQDKIQKITNEYTAKINVVEEKKIKEVTNF